VVGVCGGDPNLNKEALGQEEIANIEDRLRNPAAFAAAMSLETDMCYG